MGGGNREPKIAIKNVKNLRNEDDIFSTLGTNCGSSTSAGGGVVVNSKNNIYNLFFTIFDLCGIIDDREIKKYERSKNLLSILWETINKKEIWKEIRRFWSIQEKEILQSRMYEKSVFKNRGLQSKLSSGTSDCNKYNENIENRKKMFNMWENWKIRYTSHRWELSEQQFKQFNLFMSKLSYETTSSEEQMQDMWKTNESIRILRETLSKIQEIWRPTENKIQYRIRKLVPLETWRLMGLSDADFDKAKESGVSNAQLYKQAGNGIVVNVLMAIFKKLIKEEV